MKIKTLWILIGVAVFWLGCSNSKANHEATAGAKASSSTVEQKTVTFKAPDGLEVTADVSVLHDSTAPFIVLFHQAGWSRGEYQEIIPKLNELGFNCMAVDQRSGGAVNDVVNETHRRAEAAGKGTSYLDAYQDMEAAVSFAKANYARGKLIVWGSSYSAALVIKLAAEHADVIDGVLAFSPGEYFGRFGQSQTFISSFAEKVRCPVFITSANSERANWQGIFEHLASKTKVGWVPESHGNHGSRALWAKFSDSGAYWQQVTSFLKDNFLHAE